MSSRNQAYDSSESRRSPRDRSPNRYNESRDDYRERGSSIRGSERRRSIDSRINHNSFQSNRDNFREPLSGRDSRDFPPRDPPRGPKSLIDAPTGPRVNSYGSDYRGDFGGYRGEFRGARGRGGRGRGWRDDSRDRGRDQDRDYRDRRDDRGLPPRESYRDDRGRERDRYDRDVFRGRRQSSPQSRTRSPVYASRDSRDVPVVSDMDRTRRESRDGPLSAGSTVSDSLPQFARGYGRMRGVGRGRGRGGFYEDFHRQQGRSRSPDPNWTRRTQPSATPPPQVPAFGSTSNNALLPSTSAGSFSGMGSATATGGEVPIPTAPRSYHNGKTARHGPTSISLVIDSSKPPPASVAYSQNSPQPITDNERPALPKPTGIEEATSSKSIEFSPKNFGQQKSPKPIRKRRPIIIKRQKRATPALLEMASHPSDSDSGDDLDDSYFEEEMKKVIGDAEKVLVDHPLLYTPVPDVPILSPFIEYNIDDIIANQKPITSKDCVAPAEGAEPAIDLNRMPSSSAAKSQGKGKIRPITQLGEANTTAKPKHHSKELSPEDVPSPSEQAEHITQGKKAPSIIVPPAGPNSKVRDVPDQVLEPKPPAQSAINARKLPNMDVFQESEGEQSEAERSQELASVRKMMKTPPTSSLPKFNCKPWYLDEELLKRTESESDPATATKLRALLSEKKNRKLVGQEIERQKWKQRYYQYRKWTDYSDDPVSVRSREKFSKSRAKSAAEAAAPALSSTPAPGNKPEGQRRTGSRFATEHDIERVLRESEQEAKETKEKEDRVARARTASAKEASIPDMYWLGEEWQSKSYIDRSHLVPFERSLSILEYGPPLDNFTAEEHEMFEKMYLEFPKQWGKIAESLPRRNYQACIQHYYLTKHSSGLKEKLKKQGRKRGRGKGAKGKQPKSNALMADLRDDAEEVEGENNGERRRPKRAAAPTWSFETPQSESEVASPAATPGRKPAATPKSDAATDAAPSGKRKTKAPRGEKSKQAKSSLLLAAAPIAAANRRPDSPATPMVSVDPKIPRESTGPPRYLPQYDGAGMGQAIFPLGQPPPANVPPPVPFDSTAQLYPAQERIESTLPTNFDPQQDRRSTQQTSSYWSVPEQNDFPALLRYFGTDWQGIAKYMNTKTHIMVKNYFQRQVDSGKWKEWENLAKEADAKRARGEPTGPLPVPISIPKRRQDVTPGSIPRSGSAIDGVDDVIPSQASPPQPSLSSRFPALAQAGPVPHQPATPTATTSQHLTPKPIQQAPPQTQPPPRSSRGPPMGYFNQERPIIQPDTGPLSKRSLQVAQEAQLERSTALRLESKQREQQQQQALQRERQYQMKQESDTPNPHQYEPFSTPSMHTGGVAPQSRTEASQPSPAPVDLRRTAPPQQFHPRTHQTVRNLQIDSGSINRENKSSPSPAVPRAPLSAPPTTHEPYSAPPQPQPQPQPQSTSHEPYTAPPPAPRISHEPYAAPQSAPPAPHESYKPPKQAPFAPHESYSASQPAPSSSHESYSASAQHTPAPAPPIRQPEIAPKRSNLMSLLNSDDSTEPRPTPLPTSANRKSDVSASSLQSSRTPPPQNHLQPSRYATHSSQTASQSQHIPQQVAQQQSQPIPQPQHPYSQPSPHLMHQQTSSVGHHRSYTPTNFDGRGYGPPQTMAPQAPTQQMYPQPPRQPMGAQPAAIRRESSLGEMHGVGGGYARNSTPSQPPMSRLKESPYSASPPAPQPGRQQLGSPHDLAPSSEREFYQRQSQYAMHQQQPQSGARSPQTGPAYHHQAPQPPPSHRQLAFGHSVSHTASPPTPYATQRPLHRSRQNSFDSGRYQIPGTPTSTPTSHAYAQAPHHQNAPMTMQFQSQQQHHGGPEHFDDRFERERERARRLDGEPYLQRHRQP